MHSEADVERERVEYVFGLTGGELASERWTYMESSKFNDFYTFGARYWYEGAPEYATEFTHDYDNQYRTVITTGGGLLDLPSPALYDGEGEWLLVATFSSSGETECPLKEWYEGNPADGRDETGKCKGMKA